MRVVGSGDFGHKMGYIYQIRNLLNSAVYIGSILKRDPRHRWNAHKRDLRGNYHHSVHLQRAWNKYGESAFVFEILEHCNDVLTREQWHLDNRKNNFPADLNYNVCWIAGNCAGRRFSKKSLKRMSLSHIGHRPTPEARAKQQTAWANRCKTPYSFTAPDGTVYGNVRNLRAFSREHPELTARTLGQLHSGALHYYKKWTKTGVKLPFYQLRSPIGCSFNGNFLKHLCLKAEINYKMIHKYCIKMGKPYRGWMAEQLI